MSATWPTGHPPERPPAATARALADLARAGYEALDQPSMQVEYEILHAVDRPGTLADTVSRLADDDVFAETLSSAANGAGVIVGTRVGESRPPGPARGQRSWLEVVASADARIAFRGSERPNLTFRHESTEQFEGVIAVEDEPRKMLLRHGLAVLRTLRHIAETGVHADAPLLSLQCPAQLPPHTYQDADDIGGRAADPARSSSIAIRFIMAMERPSADVRLQIADRLARYCLDHGLGLWLRDTRAGYRAGNWFQVLPHDRTLARQKYPRNADNQGGASNAAQGCLPVTLVGPARPGSTRAILSFLAQHPQVGALGCSMSSLNELGFLHLQLAIIGATRPRISAVNAALAGIRAAGGGVQDGLRALVPLLLHGAEPVDPGLEHVERLVGRAGDYRMAMGPALTVVADHVTRRIPIWLSWRLARSELGLRLPLVALQRAVDRLDLADPDVRPATAGSPSTEYMLCRQVGGSLLWGRGKLSVSKDLVERRFAGPPNAPARLCAELQAAWNAEVAVAGHASRPGELSVSAHESWLGQGIIVG